MNETMGSFTPLIEIKTKHYEYWGGGRVVHSR
jgi:hypothetical protein